MRFIASVVCLLLALVAPPLWAADRLDTVPRVAVVSAFEPEWRVLKASLADANRNAGEAVGAGDEGSGDDGASHCSGALVAVGDGSTVGSGVGCGLPKAEPASRPKESRARMAVPRST